MDDTQKKKTIAGYMASVRFMDQQVGRLLAALDRLKIRDNTIVIFISDHGYNLGEHDCWSKVSLWEGSVRVPMVVSVPGSVFSKTRGTACNQIVELIDLYPTLLDVSGYGDKAPAILQGESLAGCLTGEAATMDDPTAYSITYGGKAGTIRTDRWRYTRWEGGEEELYDHQQDPEEHVNLSGESSSQKQLAVMRGLLEEKRKQANETVK